MIQAPSRMKDNTRKTESDNSEVYIGVPLEMVMGLKDCIVSASSVIEGFLSRFEEPTCAEQQEVVDKAKRWMNSFNSAQKAAKQIAAMMKAESN